MTLGDGSNVKYLVKAEPSVTHMPENDEHPIDTLANWQRASLGTAINIGAATMPFGIALRIAK